MEMKSNREILEERYYSLMPISADDDFIDEMFGEFMELRRNGTEVTVDDHAAYARDVWNYRFYDGGLI